MGSLGHVRCGLAKFGVGYHYKGFENTLKIKSPSNRVSSRLAGTCSRRRRRRSSSSGRPFLPTELLGSVKGVGAHSDTQSLSPYTDMYVSDLCIYIYVCLSRSLYVSLYSYTYLDLSPSLRISIYLSTYLYVSISTHLWFYIRAYLYLSLSVSFSIHISFYTYICISFVCEYVHMYVYVYMCIDTSTLSFRYVCVYVYTHTYRNSRFSCLPSFRPGDGSCWAFCR